jgi:hypothetical protein
MHRHAVVVVGDLPLTRSGKVHRRIVRPWLSGTDRGDISTLENPRSMPKYVGTRRPPASVAEGDPVNYKEYTR